jgi:hypothetical protein
MKEFGEYMANAIKVRTRLGYGVKKLAGSREKLKPLDPERYIPFRKSFPNLSGDTTPNKSNLTLTGQMLDSMQVKEVTKGKVTVGPAGPRNDTTDTNEKIAEYVAEQGRPFNTLTKPELKGLTDLVRNKITKLLKL